MKAVGVIPCRFQSSRFPGKSIALICDKPMIYHVWAQARQAKLVDKLIVAADDNRIYDVCSRYDIEAVLTSQTHRTGTDRVAEVAERIDGDLFVNIQGDEPLIDPAGIDSVVSEINKNHDAGVAITNGFSVIRNTNDVLNRNVVKVITSVDNHALAYSRSPIPYPKDCDAVYKRQIGLYAMRREIILKFPSLKRGYLELSEGIEMFRFLENGYRVKMVEVSGDNSIPVDVPDDIARVESYIRSREGRNE